jgi:DeoR family fructose operon transcriptional repressor
MDWLKHLRFDFALVGASGLDAGDGASTTELMEAAIKKEAIARARRSVLLADASKWRQTAPIRFGAWRDFSDFVTDARPIRSDREALRRAGVELHVAD